MSLFLEIKELYPKTIEIRRKLHQNPEIAFEEVMTSALVADELTKLGFQVRTQVGKTGVVGLIEGANDSPVIMLRFDMDALLVTEENEVEYKSANIGKMHACGHDAHVAIGLTIAAWLSAHQKDLDATFKLVFQPAEEIRMGAAAMIRDGILENPKPDYALGVHIWNDKPYGWMGISDGPIMAGSADIDIEIIGRGGHGAIPELTLDPILASAHVVTALQSIVSRNISPRDKGALSITYVRAGSAGNIIPPNIQMKGTIRTFEKSVSQKIIERTKQITENVATGLGCRAVVKINEATPPLVNDPVIAGLARKATRLINPDAEIQEDYQTMSSEDIALFLDKIPGAFIFVGSADEEAGKNYPQHHPRFDIDERSMIIAAAVLLETCHEIIAYHRGKAG